ncbi:MAG: PAS domain S-box protein [Rhodospirillaceae bacterium]|nr:PAS domain S-box protein [Rhodospirillaceae bacterium]
MKQFSVQTIDDRFRHSERISHICNWESDLEFNFWYYASSNTENLLGIPVDQLLGEFPIYLNYIHPDDRDRVTGVYDSVTVSQQKYEVEYRFQRPDGRTIILHEYGEPILNSAGTVLGFRGTSQDITQLRHAQEEAQRNLERFNLAEKIAAMSHWETDADFLQQTYVSDNTESLYGVSTEDMCGPFSTFTSAIHPDDQGRVLALYDSVRAEPRPYHHEFRYYPANGPMIYVSESGTPIWDDDDVVIGYRGTTQDISDLTLATLKLEKSDAYAKVIIETAIDGIITINDKGLVETVNSAAVKMFGYGADEIIGSNINLLMPPQDAERHDGYIANYLRTGEAKIIGLGRDVVGQRKNGEEFPMHLSISQVLFGDKRLFAGIVRDISERITREQELSEALIQATESSRAKSEFLSSMSHELRTPLNAIIGFSSAITAELFGPIGNIKYTEYTADINASGSHLLKLINDILDVSAIESGLQKTNEEKIDVYLTTESILRLVQPRADDGRITLSSKIDENFPCLFADERRFKQILLNLLSNAVKFTPEGGAVDLSGEQEEDGAITLRISDTGIGMDSKEIAKAMLMFGQVDSGLNRKHEGTGLGLPLTKGLIEMHGGHLEIDSTPGKGTTAIVRFPTTRTC